MAQLVPILVIAGVEYVFDISVFGSLAALLGFGEAAADAAVIGAALTKAKEALAAGKVLSAEEEALLLVLEEQGALSTEESLLLDAASKKAAGEATGEEIEYISTLDDLGENTGPNQFPEQIPNNAGGDIEDVVGQRPVEELIDELPGDKPSIGSAIQKEGDIDPISGGPIENIDDNIFGASVTIEEAGEAGIANSIKNLTQAGLIEQLESGLSDIGITKELIGETNWNKILFLIAGGTITGDEIIKLFQESNLEDLVGGELDELAGKTGLLNPAALIYIDSLGNPINITEVLNGSVKTAIDPYYIGYSTSKLTVATAWEMSRTKGNPPPDKNLLFSTLKAVQKNDEYAFMARRINQYMLTTEYIKDPLKYSTIYNYYYQIYDGKYQVEPHYEDDGFVHGVDETGREYVYDGPKGIQKFLGFEFNNPTFHGTYVGPLSPNNTLPIDTFDTSAYFHDCDYQEGWFRKNGDMKLISRVQHLLDDPDVSEKYDNVTIAKMKFTVWWFSYPGTLLASMVDQGVSGDQHTQELFADQGNFFDQILGTYDRPNQRNNLNLPEEYYFLRIKARSFAELNFWQGFKEGADQQYKFYSELYLKDQALEELDNIPIYG